MQERQLKRTFVVVAAAAVVLAGVACHDDNTTRPPTATQVVVVSGTGQSAIVGQSLTDSLAVKVLDQHGNPLSGARVTWAVTAGGGTVNPATSVTDAQGIARTSFRPGASGASNTVTATVSGVSTPATFSATGKLETFTASLSSHSEVPDTMTLNATGTATLVVNATRDTITYTVMANGLSGPATLSHIHGPAAAGTNASVRVPFTITPGVSTGTVAQGVFTAADIVNPTSGNPPPAPIDKTNLEELIGLLRSGQMYVNVHTTAHPAGEIRGQTAPAP